MCSFVEYKENGQEEIDVGCLLDQKTACAGRVKIVDWPLVRIMKLIFNVIDKPQACSLVALAKILSGKSWSTAKIFPG